ncbi:RNA polymerase-associated protein CTR9 [Vigna unguiculata]|uniref:RNA polymerase-associated protein CTR9 n=1 Tax=Vigna unguiculata TaxID=3917 RepID=A0A4D6NJF1_VIGUN|nr:RNA polymerase-associated protein CTR9 [Vigna unguiculata]
MFSLFLLQRLFLSLGAASRAQAREFQNSDAFQEARASYLSAAPSKANGPQFFFLVRAASDAMDGKDPYATLSLGNWNYFAAVRNEKRNPKLEATHLEKAKELYTRVLIQHSSNLYAANGAAVVLAEKGHFDVS